MKQCAKQMSVSRVLFPLPLGEGQGEGAKRREKKKGVGYRCAR